MKKLGLMITAIPLDGIENERFAILDIDGDEKDELLVSVSNTYTAGMIEVIYGYMMWKNMTVENINLLR